MMVVLCAEVRPAVVALREMAHCAVSCKMASLQEMCSTLWFHLKPVIAGCAKNTAAFEPSTCCSAIPLLRLGAAPACCTN
jgi:hypothetical protein